MPERIGLSRRMDHASTRGDAHDFALQTAMKELRRDQTVLIRTRRATAAFTAAAT